MHAGLEDRVTGISHRDGIPERKAAFRVRDEEFG